MFARRIGLLCLFAAEVCLSAPRPKPKLVVGIVIDQFRYDYLTRFRADYHGGLDQLLSQGADFTEAHYAQVPTVTAVGHSIFLSGAMPAVSGIVENAWYDRQAGQIVTSVCDWQEQVVGGPQPDKGTRCTDADPASPRRLLATTVGDELRYAHPDSKVIGVSLKARAAILPSGHRAAGAYWFDSANGNFISSTFYMKALPAWASAFNARKLPDQYLDRKWEGFPNWSFRERAGSKTPYDKLAAGPWGNELIEQFAEEALTGEKLGQRGATDLLTVSFSSNDYVGHRVGPNAPEVHDMAIRVDQLLGKLFHRIDEEVGLKNTIIVLSADHGVSMVPEQARAEGLPGGRIKGDLQQVVEAALTARFGSGDWTLPGGGGPSVYLNRFTMQKSHASEHDIYRVAAEALLADSRLHVARVYSREQLENGVDGDFIARAEENGFNPERSGDINVIFEPGYVPGTSGTTHFSPYRYDTHVPVLFMGPSIKAGRYDEQIEPNDIAPTLTNMLDVQTPSGSCGRVLHEMLLP